MPDRLPRLGDLEKRLLEWLWGQDWVDVRAAHAAHSGAEGRSLNTIHSTLERLIRKALVERRRQGRGFAYRAVVSREDFLEEALTDAIEQIPGSDPKRLIAAFVDVAARIDEAGLELLERRVADRRRALANGNGKKDA
jgi:predicted transcriptional regulator